MTQEKKLPTISHLLNVEKHNGRNEAGASPILKFIGAVAAPIIFLPLLYRVFAELFFSQVGGLISVGVLYVLYIARMALLIPGKELERVARYKKQLYSIYDQLGEYVRIKTVHPDDGCIQYFDNTIGFMVVAYNGNVETFSKFNRIEKFLDVTSQYNTDILVQNANSATSIDALYSGFKNFKDKEVAADYLAILDHNRQYVTESSVAVRTVFIIYARLQERKLLYNLIKGSLPEKAYFDVHMATRDEVLEVLSHEVQLQIDIDDLITTRYSTGNYYTSKVIGFDEETVIAKKGSFEGKDVRMFIPRRA